MRCIRMNRTGAGSWRPREEEVTKSLVERGWGAGVLYASLFATVQNLLTLFNISDKIAGGFAASTLH